MALTAAAYEEQQAKLAVANLRSDSEATFAQWTAHLERGALDRDGIQRFAESVAQKKCALASALDAHGEVGRLLQRAKQDHGEAQARAARAVALVRALRKKVQRRHDERSLHAMEDRIALDHQACHD